MVRGGGSGERAGGESEGLFTTAPLSLRNTGVNVNGGDSDMGGTGMGVLQGQWQDGVLGDAAPLSAPVPVVVGGGGDTTEPIIIVDDLDEELERDGPAVKRRKLDGGVSVGV